MLPHFVIDCSFTLLKLLFLQRKRKSFFSWTIC